MSKQHLETFSLIIPAAGLGDRLQQKTPKALVKRNNRSLLLSCLETFLPFKHVMDSIIVAYTPGYLQDFKESCRGFSVPIHWIEGADSRAKSVQKAFMCIQKSSWVLIHDAARIYSSQTLIHNILNARLQAEAIIPGIAITDTVKKIKNNTVEATIDREQLVRVQTPQCFSVKLLQKAYNTLNWEYVTDESQLAEKLGKTVLCIEGENNNVKITFPEDLLL